MSTSSPDTVTEAVALLEADGYTHDFNADLEQGTTVCPACGATHGLVDAEIERQYRFEGPSDPGDEAIVLGIRCPDCGERGVLISAFGPDADPALFAWLKSRPGQ